MLVSCLAYTSTLRIEAKKFSETSVLFSSPHGVINKKTTIVGFFDYKAGHPEDLLTHDNTDTKKLRYAYRLQTRFEPMIPKLELWKAFHF
jgi:hypothetical protein